MKVSFVETMRGTLRGPDGRDELFDFNIKAEAPSFRSFFGGNSAPIRGLVHAGSWTTEAPASGTLTIVPVLGRIAYRLSFTGQSGETLHVQGHKQVSPATILTGMTVLPVNLTNSAGKVLATGITHFDLRDLPAFLGSWLPGGRRAQKQLDTQRRTLERRALAEA